MATHREIFFAFSAPPYTCFFCHGPLATPADAEVVHHIDEVRTNNDPANLAAAHSSCHSSHHGHTRRRPGRPVGARGRTPLRNFRASDDTWAHWQLVAADLDTSVSSLMHEAMERRLAELGRPGPARNGVMVHVPGPIARAVPCIHHTPPGTYCKRGCDG